MQVYVKEERRNKYSPCLKDNTTSTGQTWDEKNTKMKQTRNRQNLLVSWDKKHPIISQYNPIVVGLFIWENKQWFASHEWQGWWLHYTAGMGAQEQHYEHRSHRFTRQGPVVPMHDSFLCLGTSSCRQRTEQYLKVCICQGTDVAQSVQFFKLFVKETIFGISGCLQIWLGLVLVYFKSNWWSSSFYITCSNFICVISYLVKCLTNMSSHCITRNSPLC